MRSIALFVVLFMAATANAQIELREFPHDNWDRSVGWFDTATGERHVQQTPTSWTVQPESISDQAGSNDSEYCFQCESYSGTITVTGTTTVNGNKITDSVKLRCGSAHTPDPEPDPAPEPTSAPVIPFPFLVFGIAAVGAVFYRAMRRVV